jgi:methyl-accepting chemotaxis protein
MNASTTASARQDDAAHNASVDALDERDPIAVTSDRMFGWILLAQYPIGIAIALFLSPIAWAGTTWTTHQHVLAAVVLGGLIALPAACSALLRPGRPANRHMAAVAQMLTGALWIHLSAGRPEFHFHVFVSLAMLFIYRRCDVLLLAAAVVAVDHVVRSFLAPMSVFGVPDATWRWIEHAAWVVVETGVLCYMVKSTNESARIAQSVDAISRQLEAIRTSGDLTGRIERSDVRVVRSLGRSINAFIETLQGIITEVSTNADRVATAADAIAGSTGTIAGTVKMIAAEAETSASTAEQGNDVALRGGEAIRASIEEMKSVGGAVLRSNEAVGQLARRGDEIARFTDVISDIANQTNLLALNAAIEAARAGSHGRGFAVVAEEVRSLSDRTTKATRQIGAVIEAMAADVRATSALMDEMRSQAEAGEMKALKADESLQGIVDVSQRVRSQAEEIRSSTSSASSSADRTAAACDELSQQASTLRTIVGRFRV